MENQSIKYNSKDIQNVLNIINNMVVQGINNAQAIAAVVDILSNHQQTDEEV